MFEVAKIQIVAEYSKFKDYILAFCCSPAPLPFLLELHTVGDVGE
jgi:hypothetical protein